MRKEDELEPGQAALILTYGSATRRCRALDRDVLLVGRAPGCDLGLLSPEVAPVHCVIVRTGTGWRVRDCSGRAGTRINGKSIQDEPLRDGDTVQIGTFSFEAHLPSAPAAVPRPAPLPLSALPQEVADELARVDRLRRSRRSLLQLALVFRRRLREQVGAQQQAEQLEELREELDDDRDRLRQAWRELDDARTRLEQDQAALEAARRRAEQELTRRRAEEAAARQTEREQAQAALAEAQRQAETGARARQEKAEETARSLARRAEELDHFARHLYRRRQELAAAAVLRPQEPTDPLQQLRQQKEELEQAVREAERQLSQERPQVAAERAELMRLRNEVRSEQNPTRLAGGIRARLLSMRRIREELAERRERNQGQPH